MNRINRNVQRCICRPLFELLLALCLAQTASAATLQNEDGYELWLRYRPMVGGQLIDTTTSARSITLIGAPSATTNVAIDELQRALPIMTGHPLPQRNAAALGGIVLERLRSAPDPVLGTEGYRINRSPGQLITRITANSDVGLLYGSFALLRHLQTGHNMVHINLQSAPKLKLRILQHWDNLDRSVERGYAGQSIWDWWKLPDQIDARYTDYARANASIGINGVVLNNVNASPQQLTAPYIAKAAALANIFRPYGIKVYLSARFSAPIELGGLKTADPLDPAVRAWWKAKADEIYSTIPDFGGFLVKANSEGQPGPNDYGRTHADGANMLAEAVRPHGGVIMWRAFVYSEKDNADRAMQAFSQLHPLDGKFSPNVLLQVKNGAIDFQPREPFHPLFGAMPATQLMMELQITKEYLGFANHLAYLGTLWQETLRSDTLSKDKGATVAHIIARADQPEALTGMAGVANIGTDRNWSGSHFDQANWYAFGQFAWNPESDVRQIAQDWLAMTFSTDPRLVTPAADMMMVSREAVVNYMTPLGLAHQMATTHHYGPAPWVADLARPEWNPTYYNKADRSGIGFDRTPTGSNALGQYTPGVAQQWAQRATVPLDYLLWFHHVGWDEKLSSGRTTWEELVHRYDLGVEQSARMQRDWSSLGQYVDQARFHSVQNALAVQHRDAIWWRDASLAYFMSVSGKSLPTGSPPPAHPLEAYKAIDLRFVPGSAEK